MTTTSSATTRTTAPSLRQSISRISDVDDGKTSSEADISRISRSRGGSSSRGGGAQMWYSYYKTTTHNDADCHARPANGLNGNAHFTQVRLPSVPGMCSSWDFPVGDDSDEKPCISISAREVQPATEPTKAQEEEEKVTRPFDLVSSAPTKGWQTRPWPFTPRTEQAISFGGPVAEGKSNLCDTFRLANDEEPVEKAVMTSSSVAITSEDSVNSNLATLMAPAEPLAGEVREPLLGGAPTPGEGRASPETVRPSPAPVPAIATRGTAMRDNRIYRPNVVTRCAVAEVTGAVTRYRGVHPNINNNNHAALAERFQPSTLHKLRRLNIYTNTDMPDTAHQLDAETVPVEVAYTRTNTQPSCSGGGESNRVPNTFNEAVGLPQAAHWKTASDKEIESLEKHGVFNLVLITSILAGHRVVDTRWVREIKADSNYIRVDSSRKDFRRSTA